MIRAVAVRPTIWRGYDRVTLSLEQRRKRRHTVVTELGLEILVDLPHPPMLRDGDGLVLEDGKLVLVRGEVEQLLEIDHCDALRIAWHLGNRHTPTEVTPFGQMRIRPDHVIEAMLKSQGARLKKIECVFEPEGGAYQAHHHEDAASGGVD